MAFRPTGWCSRLRSDYASWPSCARPSCAMWLWIPDWRGGFRPPGCISSAPNRMPRASPFRSIRAISASSSWTHPSLESSTTVTSSSTTWGVLSVRPRHPDLLLVAAFAVVAAGVVLTSPGGGITRVVLGLPLALVLPGYALTLGSSLASLAILGLALNWTSWGLTPASWTVAVATETLAATLLAIIRRRRRATDPVRFSLGGISRREWGTFGLAAVTLVAALMIVRAGALEPRAAGFTQLWILPGTQTGGDEVRIGITSQERSTVTYELDLESDSQVVQTWSSIELAPGKTWQAEVMVKPIRPGARTAAVLFRLDLPHIAYRRVALAGSK